MNHDLAAADIIAARHALGIDRWAINTSGGGTDLAVRVVGADPDAVTALVTRAPQAVGHGMTPNTVNEAFEAYATDCAASADCAKGGDLRAALAARLDRPATATAVNDRDGEPVSVDKISTQLGVANAMASGQLAPVLPAIINGPDDGGTTQASAFVDNGDPDPTAAELVAECQDLDYVLPGTAAADDHAGPFVGMSYRRVCDAIGPVPQMTPLGTTRSDIPVLVLLAAYDGRSSRSTADAIFAGFTNVTVLAIPHVADPTAQMQPCYDQMRTAFVEHPATPDTTCVTTSTVRTFP